ncbi:BglG family transcription antiterminator [Lacrimispora indolis]|uniref:BglG family transcription antiterminator n=1 Tax=Lacrimispora indolis TaxID=69825 RepID=UPI00045EA365|nr:PTS sugar transporter subunit IIA [Lacrimispora indolis]MBE7717916.1 transcription antiterminator [Lacrimispora celerecrescens]
MDNRLSEIFRLVCQSKHEFTVRELAQQFSVSTRTVYSDIKKLNELLEASGHAEINADKGKMFYKSPLMIEFESLIHSNSDYVLWNPRIRRLRIIESILLSGDQFTVDDLLKELDISRNTLIGDLKEVKEMLSFHSIAVEATPFKGYRISGKERNIRNLLILSISEDLLFFEDRTGKRNLQILYSCEDFLDDVARQLNIELSDVSFNRMLIAFYVTYARISIGKAFTQGSKDILTREEKAFVEHHREIEAIFGREVSLDDCFYLANKLAEASVVKSEELLSEKWLPFNLVTNQFIDVVAKEYPFEAFRTDSKLYEGLLNHLRPAYKRALAGEWAENPLLSYVLENFAQLNKAVAKGVKVLEEKLKVHFHEHEISYFTLFFASVIERNEKQIRRTPNVIIVCNAGISTSEILKSRLQAIFHVNILGTFSVRNAALWLMEHVPDLIISTVPFQWQDTKVLKVSPYLSDYDIKEIQGQLSFLTARIHLPEVMNIIGKYVEIEDHKLEPLKNELSVYLGITENSEQKKGIYQPMLKEILTADLIKAKFVAANRDEAVKESGRLLVDKGLADEAYIQAMLKNVEVNGTYIVISPGIAMPHARPEEGALDIGLSIVTLKEPVVFGHPKNDPVKIVVGLCAIDHQSHLKALTELADILMDAKKVEEITNAESAEQILQIIKGDSL